MKKAVMDGTSLQVKDSVISYDQNVEGNHMDESPWLTQQHCNTVDYNITTVFLKSNPDFQRSVTYHDVFTDEECDKIIDWMEAVREQEKEAGVPTNEGEVTDFDEKLHPNSPHNPDQFIPQDTFHGDDMTSYNQNKNTDYGGKGIGLEQDSLTWRKSSTTWMSQMEMGYEWVWERIDEIVQRANKDYFKFDMPNPTIIEPFQVTYYPPGGVYEWHQDWDGNIQPMNTRKISLGVQLSDPDWYTGGNLQFQLPRTEEANIASRKRGSITLFPSFIMHRLSTVVTGERYSLVGWCHGNIWR